jgi:hypothetical protein
MPDDVGRIQVTPHELGALATAVARVRDQLERTADLGQDYGPALGSQMTADALNHFVSGWHDARAQISADIRQLSDLLAQAATAYGETDGGLAAAMS